MSDRALMAMIKQRYVPFYFVLRQVQKKPTIELGMEVVRALQALRPGNRRQHEPAVGAGSLLELDVHFAIINEVLHICGGTLIDARGVEVHEITEGVLREAMSAKSRTIGREFEVRRYNELSHATSLYERVLRECERATSLEDALSRVRYEGGTMDKKTYERIKATMNRYGLMREPVFARWMLIEGPLTREIEQQFIGKRLEDVIPAMLRDALERVAKPGESATT